MPVSVPWRVALCVAPLLVCGCSVGIYAPYPPPIPCAHRGRTLSVAAGVPHQVEYQQRVFGRADLVLGTALLTFHADSAAGALSAAGLLGVRCWMLPVDRRVFNVGVSGGATFIRSAHGGADTTLTGGELSVTPGFFTSG